jgi:hypothetical protein
MLLKTKEAVRTCVLSKRWERLWISLPFLNITCHSLEGMSHSLSLLTNAERLELCVTCPQLQVCNLFRKIQIQIIFFFNSKPLTSKYNFVTICNQQSAYTYTLHTQYHMLFKK